MAVDGRGRQQLVQDPRNGGAATVRIEDSDGGAGTYTFDLMWDAQGPEQYFPGPQGRATEGALRSREIRSPTVTSITANEAGTLIMAAT